LKAQNSLEEYLIRLWNQLIGRITGPLSFRLILQPLVVVVLAIRSGVKDARQGRSAFGWAAISDSGRRGGLLKEGWEDVAKVFFMAVVIDIIYQLIVFHWIYPLQPLIVATILVLIPYPLVRGLTNRIVQFWQRKK
jgi:hypothetical protein